MDIVDFFSGGYLNAVDAKGRVSLPSAFRAVIERRQRRAALPGETPVEDKIVRVGEHEEFACLRAFDDSYMMKLRANVERRVAKLDDVDPVREIEIQSAREFGSLEEIAYDGGGRMVLPAQLRKDAGIRDLVFFVGAGETIQIWTPENFKADPNSDPRLLRKLDGMLAERGAK